VATWGEFEAEQPALAASVRDRFDVRKHKTLATLRADGSPRISGIEVEFADGQIYLGMMPDSHKLNDLRRDPRLAVHSPTEDAPEGAEAGWPGEAKIAGTARAVDFPDSPVDGGSRFAVDLTEVVLTHLNDAADRLVIESWHPGRGLVLIERT
jgi:Pyridoxamine 5'-phosphate oxidase